MKRKLVGIVVAVTLVLSLGTVVHATPDVVGGGGGPPPIAPTSAPLPPPCYVPEM